MKLGAWSVFLIGYGLGILTSYTFFKDKYRKKADEEIKSVREHLENFYNADKKKEGGDEKEETDNMPTGEVRSSLSDRKDGHYVYTGKYTYKVKDPAEREFPHEEDDEDDTPIETTIDDYMGNTKYGKMSLTWYTDDKTLARNEYGEDEDELVDDECNYLGNVLESSGFKYNDVSCIYIRNPQTQTIYEVTKCYGRYRG